MPADVAVADQAAPVLEYAREDLVDLAPDGEAAALFDAIVARTNGGDAFAETAHYLIVDAPAIARTAVERRTDELGSTGDAPTDDPIDWLDSLATGLRDTRVRTTAERPYEPVLDPAVDAIERALDGLDGARRERAEAFLETASDVTGPD